MMMEIRVAGGVQLGVILVLVSTNLLLISGLMYREKRMGPNTDPWGTLSSSSLAHQLSPLLGLFQ